MHRGPCHVDAVKAMQITADPGRPKSVALRLSNVPRTDLAAPPFDHAQSGWSNSRGRAGWLGLRGPLKSGALCNNLADAGHTGFNRVAIVAGSGGGQLATQFKLARGRTLDEGLKLTLTQDTAVGFSFAAHTSQFRTATHDVGRYIFRIKRVAEDRFRGVDRFVDLRDREAEVMGLALANTAKSRLVGLLAERLQDEGVCVGEGTVAATVRDSA